MSTATDMLANYLAAEAAILGGQSYKWGDRQLTRADLAMVQNGRREWERKVNAENRFGSPVGVQLAVLNHSHYGPEGFVNEETCFRSWP